MAKVLAATSFAVALFLISSAAFARGTIAEVGIKNRAPATGSRLDFQVAVIGTDAAGLKAGEYSVQIELRDPNGVVVLQSDAVPAAEAATTDRATVILVGLTLPDRLSGPLEARALLLQGGATVDSSEAETVTIGALALAPVTPAPAAPGAPGGFTLTGNLAGNADVANNVLGQSALLSLDAKMGEPSFSASGGLTTSVGGNKPVFSYRSHNTQIQAGTFGPSFDPLIFDGPTGLALQYRNTPSDRSGLQGAFLLAARGSLNPYTAGALNYLIPIGATSKFGITAVALNVEGPQQTSAEPQLSSGEFFALGLDHTDPRSILGYGIHAAYAAYRDRSSNRSFNENAFTATLNGTLKKASWDASYRRASPFYPTITASGATPDRETAAFNLHFPLGVMTTTLGVTTDGDDLPGAGLAQRTRAVGETASLSLPLKNGDSLSLSFTANTSHQQADRAIAPTGTDAASAGDGTNFAYNAKRGDYTFGYTLGYNNQHDDKNSMQHVTQNGLTVSRAVAKGLTFTTAVNLTTTVAAAAASTSSALAGSLALGYVTGPLNLSGSFGTTRSRPFFGLRSPDSSTMNLSAKIAPYKNFAVQAGFTQSVSGRTIQSGTVNVTQKL